MIAKRFIIAGQEGRMYTVGWQAFCNFLDYIQSQGVEVGSYRDDHAFRYYRKDTGRVIAWSEDTCAGAHSDADDKIERACCIR